MPVSTLDNDTRNAMVNAANTELNDGGGPNATYEYLTAADAVLITWNLDGTNPYTAAGSTTQGEAELTGQPINGTATATGTASKYQIKDKAGTVRRSGTLDATVPITSGQIYPLSATVTQPAS